MPIEGRPIVAIPFTTTTTTTLLERAMLAGTIIVTVISTMCSSKLGISKEKWKIWKIIVEIH